MGAEFSREVEEYPMSAQKNVYIVPEIYYLKNLVKIDLRHNYISGTVPSEIARLKLLRELNLYGNNISGSLPVELYSMQGLERLVIGRNQLTGVIVPEITGLARLRELHLGYNSITGYLPTSLGALVSLGKAAFIVFNITIFLLLTIYFVRICQYKRQFYGRKLIRKHLLKQ